MSVESYFQVLTCNQLLRFYESGLIEPCYLKSIYNIVSERIIFDNIVLTHDEINLYDSLRLTVNGAAEEKSHEHTTTTTTVTSASQSKCVDSIPSTSGLSQRNTSTLYGYGSSNVNQNNSTNITPYVQQHHDEAEEHGGCNGECSTKNNTNLRYVSVEEETIRCVRRFNLHGKRTIFKLRDAPNDANPIQWLTDVMTELVGYSTSNFNASDMVGLVIENMDQPERPLGISFRRCDQLSAAVIIDVIGRVLQSNAQFFTSDRMAMKVDRVVMPEGSGGSFIGRGITNIEWCMRKYSITYINNNDHYCLAYSLIVGIAFRTNEGEYNIMRNKTANGLEILYSKALALCRAAGVDLSQRPGCYADIVKFQEYLTDFTIVVYNDRQGKNICFEGNKMNGKPTINLILLDNHFSHVNSLTGAFACGYFCEQCHVRSSRRDQHLRCPFKCPCCHISPPHYDEVSLKCNDCSRDFRGQECLTKHVETGLCQRLKRCKTCLVSIWVKTKAPHKCGYKYCNVCMKSMPIRHDCYIQVNTLSNKKCQELRTQFMLIFYDFETRQELALDVPGKFKHEVNMCVAQQCCAECINEDNINIDCIKCGKRQHIFDGDDPVATFLEYIGRKLHTYHVTALAHNAKGFDSCFIIQKLFADIPRWTPSVIRNGTKLMSITCGSHLRFIDSINFMPMPLAKLPSAYKFVGIKGYFPYLFNIMANANYVGPIPDASFYSPDTMKPKDRNAFMLWYEEQRRQCVIFDMKQELLNYCIGDVDILRRACIRFRDCFIKTNNVYPFLETSTIAGACNLVYRRNYLTPDTIGIIPQGGYRMRDQQSVVAIKWLLWMEYSTGTAIKHAGVSREVRLRENILVDGYCEGTNTVLEFNGCYYHGHDCLINQTVSIPYSNEKEPSNTSNKRTSLHNDSLFQRREQTKAKEDLIRSLGYNLIVKWECEFQNDIKTIPHLKQFLEDRVGIFKESPLDPRDAFFGGRTNACKLYHKCNPNERIRYFDVCSLYPYVNKYGKCPIGHPKIHLGNDECLKLNIDIIEGLVKCTVLPPLDLYHPLLPYKLNGKLLFPLCLSCAVQSANTPCQHTSDERMFTGTYVADELRKAISLGYRVVEIHEIWEYEVTVYNSQTKAGGLFAGYVNNFLKHKQESSGWPSWCTDDQLKKSYVDQYEKREGITLEPNNIVYNAGLRQNSKLMLTSLWGKFGQRTNLMQTSLIDKAAHLFKLLSNPSVEVHDITRISDTVLLCAWNHVSEAIQPLKTVNVAIAAYTTANARLILYSYLEKLDRRVLYFDTDSVLFTQDITNPNEWLPSTGDFLGDMTDEILGEYGNDAYITEFVSGGPKNYAYKVIIPNENRVETICKVKGLNLNYQNSLLVNFDCLKDMILNDLTKTINIHNDRSIVRTKIYDVVSQPADKIYRVNYTKRQRLDNSYDTLPYGFRSSSS